MNPDELNDREYLGDGVYIGHDGYQFWLYVERDFGLHYVALDMQTLASFERYIKRIKDRKGG